MKARRRHAKTRGRGNREDSGKAGVKRRFVEAASDSSDEDFVVDEEEEEEEDDDNCDIVSNEEEEEEETEESTSDEYREETLGASKPRKTGVRTRGRAKTSRKKPRNRATKRVKILSSEDEDFQPDLDSSTDDSEDDNDDEEVVVTKQSRTRSKRVRKPKKSSTRVPKKGRRRRRRRTHTLREVAKKQTKIAPASRKSATQRRQTIPVSQNLVRNMAGNNCNSDEDYSKPTNQRAKKQRTCSSNSKRESKLQRRRKVTSSSASDFSDLDSDYTVREEDNEPLFRPAHCRKPASRLTRSSLIQKQEIVSIATNRDNQKDTSLSDCNFNKTEERLRKKGKEKIEGSLIDGNSELGKPVCGVCLSDDGKAYRGKLDCCDHYFCFACIMEWAKVESRCPMCKQRFVSISKSGKGLHGRKISIPKRDQVIFSKQWLRSVSHQQLGL